MSVTYALMRALCRCVAPAGERARLPILFYHRVLRQSDTLLPTEPDAAVFDAHMRAVASVFRVLPLGEAVERLGSGTLPARAACITFDDGYRDNFEIAVPILRRHGLVATFFIATGYLGTGRMFNDTVIEVVRRLPAGDIDLSWIGLAIQNVHDDASRARLFGEFVGAVKYLPAEQRQAACDRLASIVNGRLPVDLMMTMEQVRGLVKHGMSVGGHTVDHPILVNLPDELARSQITQNRNDLAALVGTAPTLFAYPNGKPGVDYTIAHARMVEDAGYHAAVSTGWGVATPRSNTFQLPRIGPHEVNAARFVARVIYNTGLERSAPEAI